jgi:uncharacterized membrane protein
MVQRELDFARLTNLADGIFAVAMTFLAFTIQIPPPSHTPDGDLAAKIVALLPQLGALALTYLLAARYWALHCEMHRIIVRGDGNLVALNILLLLTVVLLPFTTDVLGTYPLSGLSVGIYCGNIGVLAMLFWSIWHYAVHHPRCLASDAHLREARVFRRIAGAIAVIILLAAALSQLLPRLGLVILLLVPIGQGGLRWLSRRVELA